MNTAYYISITLDKRRPNKTGLFPVRVRVYTRNPRRQKLYATSLHLSQHEYESAWETQKPKQEHKSLRNRLLEIERYAENIASELPSFTFEQFEKAYLNKEDNELRVAIHFARKVSELHRQERVNTAISYELAERSLKHYLLNCSTRKYNTLTFLDITPDWLNQYEEYWVGRVGHSPTTIGIYLRNLRYLFNTAIEGGVIERNVYPFGRRRYVIPTSRKNKKALSAEQLKKLYNAIPQSQEQKKAQAFWFFSFACSGMNVKDIALLRHADIEVDKLHFTRAKTRSTTKANSKSITVYLNDISKAVIEEYGSDRAKSEYLFPILEGGENAQLQRVKIQNFTRFINQHIKKLCSANMLPGEISTYWARHSFATVAIQQGASMEFIQESLGHVNLQTTQQYFAGFENDVKAKFSNDLAMSLIND